MKQAIIIALFLIASSHVAAMAGGTVVAPPLSGDSSCAAKAARVYPWATQGGERQLWQAFCEQPGGDGSGNYAVNYAGPGVPNGGGMICMTSQVNALTLSMCK
jgi:hypothetical protein